MDLNTNNTFEINDISISNSSSKFLQLSGIKNAPSGSKILNINNVQLTNATINFQNNLIEFGDIETQADFTIIISNILFSNINFVAGGNMLSLQHQTANTMVIQNSVFQNIYGGSVTIESANKQRLDLPTKVWFQNLTALFFLTANTMVIQNSFPIFKIINLKLQQTHSNINYLCFKIYMEAV